MLETFKISYHGQEFDTPSTQWVEFIFNCRQIGKRGDLYHHDDYICGPLTDGGETYCQ